MPVCSTCNVDKPNRDFPWGRLATGVCQACSILPCAGCKRSKPASDFSLTQMQNEDARKCRSCTGEGSKVLMCRTCKKSLPLSAFKRESRTPGEEMCNECRRQTSDDDDWPWQGYTGEYVAHGEWDTLTGMDDGSGVHSPW